MIGVSKDESEQPALRMALQTREQHIRRGKATSNICTAQVLPAVLASMYAVYYGPEGLRRIATSIHGWTKVLAGGLRRAGHCVRHSDFFDTVRVEPVGLGPQEIRDRATARRINLRYFEDGSVGVAFDETVGREDVEDVLAVFSRDGSSNGEFLDVRQIAEEIDASYEGPHARQTSYLDHPTFHRYRSETELMRYARRLASTDVSLTDSMIPLGSCTMKLNGAAALEPLSWPAFGAVHPFAPPEQAEGVHEVMTDLKDYLLDVTGFDAATLQPPSGATGEYTGLLVIQAYQEGRGEGQRDVCLVPESAHGTNPASAHMAGMDVAAINCDENGNVDLGDLRAQAEAHGDRLAAAMITYPSTHGIFEAHVADLCDVVHSCGGQVYLDGANLNAMAGLIRPASIGADVCHLNLHKTFAVPHGGGGPGSGPVCVRDHLAPFLPGHPLADCGGNQAIGPVGGAPYGSPLLYLVSWAYLRLLGREGLASASKTAVVNANYLAEQLSGHYDIVYRGPNGRVAHEFILDLCPFRKELGVTEQDVAKRLMDYGFHAPTTSWPVLGGLMIEPTESESRAELDRFCEAMIAIREEIAMIERGDVDAEESPLKQAPHTASMIATGDWPYPYSRERAAFPAPWTRANKTWPAVRRVDAAYGDRNLTCTCPPLDAYEEPT
jgi:glycine dehydrogenase